MKNIDARILSALFGALCVLMLLAAYKFGETKLSIIIQDVQFALSQEINP